mgnify:CR=1 FL=1
MKNFFLICITFFFFSLSHAAEKSSGFLQMQSILGKWEGTLVRSAQENIPISLEYKLISDGSAIVEHSNEDGVEMMTAFADQSGELLATHYCALGNQPKMTISKSTETSVSFSTDRKLSGLDPAKDSFVDTWTFSDLQKDADQFTYTYTVLNSDNTVETNSAVMRRTE